MREEIIIIERRCSRSAQFIAVILRCDKSAGLQFGIWVARARASRSDPDRRRAQKVQQEQCREAKTTKYAKRKAKIIAARERERNRWRDGREKLGRGGKKAGK